MSSFKFLFNFCIALSTLFFSCKDKDDAEARASTFFYNQTGGLESLDPAFARSLAIMWQVHQIYNTLVEVDTHLHTVPSLAHRWEIDSSGYIYRFFLRDDVYFHDNEAFAGGKGRKMNADDVVYSFLRIIDPATASSGAWIFNDKVQPENPFVAVNDSTVEVRLLQPFAPFLQLLSMPYCSIVPQEVVEKFGTDFRSNACGTGPFFLKKWDEGNTLILHRNERYWEYDAEGERLPYLRAVQVSFNESKAMEYLRIAQGKLDYINGIDGSIKDLVLAKNGTLKPEAASFLRLYKKPYLNTEYLGILMDSTLQTNPALKLRKVRAAINLAIDKKKIITYFRNGIGQPAHHGFTPLGMPGMNPERAALSGHDPARATMMIREVLDSTGWNQIYLEIAAPESLADMCNFIAQQLQEVGIAAKVQVYQPGMMRQLMSQGKLSCFKAQWIADYPDAESYLAYFLSTLPAPPNYTRYNNPTFDRWYQEAIAIDDPQQRSILYQAADSLVAGEYAVIPLFYDELLSFVHQDVQGVFANSLNILDIKYARKKRKD